MGVGRLAVFGDQAAEIPGRLGRPAGGELRQTDIVAGVEVSRINPQTLAESPDRVVQPARRVQGVGQIIVALDQVRIDAQGLLVERDGLINPPQAPQDDAEVAVQDGVAGLQHRRPAQAGGGAR